MGPLSHSHAPSPHSGDRRENLDLEAGGAGGSLGGGCPPFLPVPVPACSTGVGLEGWEGPGLSRPQAVPMRCRGPPCASNPAAGRAPAWRCSVIVGVKLFTS